MGGCPYILSEVSGASHGIQIQSSPPLFFSEVMGRVNDYHPPAGERAYPSLPLAGDYFFISQIVIISHDHVILIVRCPPLERDPLDCTTVTVPLI